MTKPVPTKGEKPATKRAVRVVRANVANDAKFALVPQHRLLEVVKQYARGHPVEHDVAPLIDKAIKTRFRRHIDAMARSAINNQRVTVSSVDDVVAAAASHA